MRSDLLLMHERPNVIPSWIFASNIILSVIPPTIASEGFLRARNPRHEHQLERFLIRMERGHGIQIRVIEIRAWSRTSKSRFTVFGRRNDFHFVVLSRVMLINKFGPFLPSVPEIDMYGKETCEGRPIKAETERTGEQHKKKEREREREGERERERERVRGRETEISRR